MSEVTFGLIAMSLILLPFVVLFCVMIRRGGKSQMTYEGAAFRYAGHNDGRASYSEPHFIDTIDR